MITEDYLATEFELTSQNDCGGDKVTMEDFYKSNIATNNLIIEDYCSNEISNLLNEKGAFSDIDLHWKYNADGKKDYRITHQMAMKWLREVYDIHVIIDRGPKHYFVVLTKTKPYQIINMKNHIYDSYEEAVGAALKYCLTNLINNETN